MRKLTICAILLVSFTLFTPVAYGGFGNTWASFGPWSTGENLTDPSADRIPMWDDSAGIFAWIDSSTPLDPLYATTIELGHATDTTIARVSAGVVSIEGVSIPTASVNLALVTSFGAVTDGFRFGDSGEPNMVLDEGNDIFQMLTGDVRIQKREAGTAIVNTTSLGVVQFFGDDDTASADEIAGQIEVIATGTWTDGAEDAKLVLNAANNGTLNANQVVLNTDGSTNFGGNVTAVGSFIIGSADMTEADLEKLDGITDGTAAASKALVLNSGFDITTGLDSLTATTLTDGTASLSGGVLTGLTTPLTVAQGGTGANTFTDGYVLLGSVTGAITALNTTGDGAIMIGDGTTDPVALDVGSSTAITILGTVATGTWQATDVGVEYGGTGVSSLTDGGVLFGSGMGAVTVMAVLSDSELIVGDGTTDPVAESGGTLRTSIGVGTGDSPQFTGIELGHASDTTITRTSAGDLSVEGNKMYRVDGNDVDVADGGTGVGTLTDGGPLLGSGTNDITAMSVLGDGEIIIGDGTTDPVALDVGSSTAITILGTVATGTWQATAIADSYVPNNITIDLATLATTAASGDSAENFFGTADVVTDQTVVTDVEGTGLSITGATLNWSAASTDLTDTADLLYEAELDSFSELDSQISDKALVNFADGGTFTGNLIANSNLSIGNATTTAGVLTLLEDDDDGSNFASFMVPALTANTVYTLPPDDGDNTEVLQTNGSGVLTWVANGGGDEWGDAVDADILPTGNDNTYDLGSVAASFADIFWDGMGTGNVTGDLTGNAATATLAATVTVSDDESTADAHEIVFTTDNVTLESDGTLTYNPSTGTVDTTALTVGNITSTGVLDVSNGVNPGGIVFGADLNTTTRTDATRKFGSMIAPHYTNAEEKVQVLIIDNNTNTNTLSFGGGQGGANALTDIKFFAAADSTTTTGTLTALINDTGLGIFNENPESILTVGANSTTQGVGRFWDGGGGNTPGHIILGSPNGTLHYFFVEDDGTLKQHTAAPTQNTDGNVVGAQT